MHRKASVIDEFAENSIAVGGHTLKAGTIERILEWVAFGDSSKKKTRF